MYHYTESTPAEPARACLLEWFAETVQGHCLPAGARGAAAHVLRAPAHHETKNNKENAPAYGSIHREKPWIPRAPGRAGALRRPLRDAAHRTPGAR